MGVLPLQFRDEQGRESLGLTGQEVFDVEVDDDIEPRQLVKVTATDPKSGKATQFLAQCRIDTPVEVDYYKNGGILQAVLRKLLADGESRKGVAKS
jgi:aconitate hydratase